MGYADFSITWVCFYSDRAPDFCDLCVIRLSAMFTRHTVATVDRRDFTTYRRFGRQIVAGHNQGPATLGPGFQEVNAAQVAGRLLDVD